MASKNFTRGDKRFNGVKIVRANRLTAKSSAELKDKVVDQVAKANKFTPAAARSMVNWILRPSNRKIVAGIKTSTTTKKAPAAQAA